MSVTAFSSGDLGDLIATLPILRHLGGAHLKIGNHYKCGSSSYWRPIKGEKYESIVPLLQTCPYIHSVTYSEDRHAADYDLSDWRICYKHNQTLTQSQADYFGINNVDMSPWLKVDPSQETKDCIVINRTARYRDNGFNWNRVLRKTMQKVIFIGFQSEYDALKSITGRPFTWRKTQNLLEVAQLIAGSALFIGNQSAACWIAMGLGHPLMQETNKWHPDAMVRRENAVFYAK